MSEQDALDVQAKKIAERLGLSGSSPIVQNADTVNVDQPREKIPHVRIVAAVTFCILAGFAWVTHKVLTTPGADATVKGTLIGTWATLAIGAAGFWLGSSVGGKLNK